MSFKDRLSFIQGDGLEIIHQFHDRPDIVFFVDPPYTASQKKPGNRLYNYSNIDHHKLFKLL